MKWCLAFFLTLMLTGVHTSPFDKICSCRIMTPQGVSVIWDLCNTYRHLEFESIENEDWYCKCLPSEEGDEIEVGIDCILTSNYHFIKLPNVRHLDSDYSPFRLGYVSSMEEGETTWYRCLDPSHSYVCSPSDKTSFCLNQNKCMMYRR